jgi:threonine dehydratase
MKQTITLNDIKKAQKNITGIVKVTDLIQDYSTSKKFKANVYFKLENTQIVKSFKIRGALNAIKNLTAEQRKAGVIAASAGNHAQGVAYSATQLGIKSVIVMPNSAPLAKVKATLGFGGEVVFGPTPLFDDANKLSKDLAAKQGFTLIPPYDDPNVIAGQGTIGLEILQQNPEIDTVIVQIGGGGLIAGIATAIKAIKPSCEIYGVQTENFPDARDLYKGDHLKTNHRYQPSIADGIHVKAPSPLAIDIMKKNVKDIVTVTNTEIEKAILWLAEKVKVVAEGAGAVGLAAVLAKKINIEGKNVALIISGGNIDVDRFINACMNTLTRENRRIIFNYWYTPSTFKTLVGSLQSISGRIYMINQPEPLCLKDKLPKG